MTEKGWKIVSGLCNKIQYLSNLIEDLTFKCVEEKIINLFMRLHEEKLSYNRFINLQLTHQDIASMTGTVREVVLRVMSKLKKEGVIVESTPREFTIDKERLLKIYEIKFK